MKEENLDFFIVNATDEYLNEYIDLKENSRYLLTGFSGSTGDALVTHKDVFLFVDGRYHLQAEKETNENFITVVKLDISTHPFTALIEKIAEISTENQTVGFTSTKISVANFKKLCEKIKNINFKELDYDPVLKFADIKLSHSGNIRYISEKITGLSAKEKFEQIKKKLDDINIDIFILTKLEEIAYLSNLRGNEIPFSSSFKAKAIIYKDKLTIFIEKSKISADITKFFGKEIEFKNINSFCENLQNNISRNNLNIGYEPKTTNLFTYRQIEKTQDKLIEIEISPIAEMMAIKNDSEFKHLQDCFKRTDIVVNKTIKWVNKNIRENIKISEKDLADYVKASYIEEGAYGLSFEVIAASGKNTAIIHHTNPDSEKFIQAGDLVLLDCGGYFEGGYATDITRTFLASSMIKADKDKKKIYTRVLKAFLHGLNYEITGNNTGFDIDNKVREIINENLEEGFKFSHGTGHGIGISVHESLPRLGSTDASKIKLEPGMCFTIEPGLYNDNWGGVRLENAVSIVKTDFGMKIQTLAKSKFDETLIDYNELNKQEIQWLRDYQENAAE